MTSNYSESGQAPGTGNESVTPGPQGYSSVPLSPEYGASYPSNSYDSRQTRPEHPNATMVLLLGVVGLFIPILSFIGWYVGSSTRKEAAEQGYQTGGNLQFGWALSIALSIFQLGIVALFLLAIVALGLFAIA